MVSFVIHATRGILRDQSTRRKAMGFSVLIAVLLVIAGSTFLRSTLNPHEHPGRFILFWFACAWMTMLVLLLALLDLLLTRAQARAARKLLREQFSQPPTPDSQTPPRHE
jgi:hypothetical protein